MKYNQKLDKHELNFNCIKKILAFRNLFYYGINYEKKYF